MINLLALVVIVAFAGYRLARAVAVDEITSPFRRLLYRRAYESLPPRRSRVFLSDLFSCPLCIGFWMTLVLGLVASTNFTDGSIFQHGLIAMASAGGQCLLNMRESPG